MKLHSILKPDMVKVDCRTSTKEGILEEIITDLKKKKKISDDKVILSQLMDRERLGSTSIGYHAAIPHTKIRELKEPIIFIAVSKKGIQYHENDKELVHLIILVITPNDTPILHLQILAAAASLIKKSKDLTSEVLSVTNPKKLIGIIKKMENMNG